MTDALHPNGRCTCGGEGKCVWCKRVLLLEIDDIVSSLKKSVEPLVKIADAYDANALDNEARKHWGKNYENTNNEDPNDITLYSGRGGKELLTLSDCLKARETVKRLEEYYGTLRTRLS